MDAVSHRMGAEMAEKSRAVRELVDQEGARLWKFIRGRVGADADADDVMQDVLAQLAAVSGPIESATSWLYSVARNRLIDRYRRRKLAIAEPRADEDGLELGLDAWLEDGHGTPEDDYLRSLLWSELDLALAELPPAQRDVFVWHELEGMSFKDMAEATGDKVPTLISRKRYAVLFLRERLAELYEMLV